MWYIVECMHNSDGFAQINVWIYIFVTFYLWSLHWLSWTNFLPYVLGTILNLTIVCQTRMLLLCFSFWLVLFHFCLFVCVITCLKLHMFMFAMLIAQVNHLSSLPNAPYSYVDIFIYFMFTHLCIHGMCKVNDEIFIPR